MYDRGGAPIELLERTLCRDFNCTPQELDRQDGARLLRMVYAERAAEAFHKKKYRLKMTEAEDKLVTDIMRAEARAAGLRLE